MKKMILSAVLLSSSWAQAAQWVSNDNAITFLTTKVNQENASITEQSSFQNSQARLDESGNFVLEIDLNSVQTNVEIRDERLRDWVFQTDKFTQAKVSATLDVKALEQLAVGEVLKLQQPLMLELHGEQVDLQADLAIQKVAEDKLMVSTLSPVIVDTSAVNMKDGVAELVKVMALSSIVQQVPVSFNAQFVRQ
ncbi:YceI family protein [Rappaport israeli]|uniref:YceI family protein n=1 Tax=Rappaport israeli TaxID=1839807 RepID=UPI0009302907|nr:YceI family protein [Rappaport israeli]